MSTATITENQTQREAAPGSAERSAARYGGNNQSRKLSTNLGWFSIGLGLTEIIAPNLLSRCIGAPRRPGMMRLMGVREVIAGIGILTAQRPESWLWARVGGDMLDMTALLKSSGSPAAGSARLGVAITAVAGVTALDIMCAQNLGAARRVPERSLRFSASTAINRSPQECYRYWRDLENFPTFFKQLTSVRTTGEGRSHWIAKGPAGTEISWDAAITEDIPNEQIAWRSLEGAMSPNSGSVRFEPIPGSQGTIVRLRMAYELPFRAGRSAISGFLGHDPGHQLRKGLSRFKQMLEAGEISTTEGQPAGDRSGATFLDRMVRI